MFNFRLWNRLAPIKPEPVIESVSVETFSTAPRRLVSNSNNVSRGAFSTVFESVIPNTVVKRGSDLNDGYLLFLACVFDLGPLPIFPQIHMVYIDKRLGEFWVLMEKLAPQPEWTGDWQEDPRLRGDYPYDYERRGKLGVKDISHLTTMFDWLVNSGYSFNRDLHVGNWMYRDKQPVVIDPITDGGDRTGYLEKLEEVVRLRNRNILVYGD